jgi:hypothetical protein
VKVGEIMTEFPPIAHEPRVYRLKWWAQAWYLALGLFVLGIGTAHVAARIMGGDRSFLLDWDSILFFVFFPAGYYSLALALRSRVVLDETTISVRGAIREKSANLCDIKGYRIAETKNASYWRLELKDKSSNISIMRSFDVDDDFRALLSNLRNLEVSEDI